VKILVYPHDLGLGGSQLNAIEIAAAVKKRGHDVILFGRRGALVARAEQLGLEFVESPQPGRRPSPRVVDALTDLIDARGIQVLHGYEWPPALESVLAARRRPESAAVATGMSMSGAPVIPRTVPLLVGTEEIAATEIGSGRTRVGVLEPPVDLDFNQPGVDVGLGEFRRRWGLDDSRLTVVSVTRFARELKLEGTLAAIDAVGSIAADFPVRLVLVGDGSARDDVESRASAVNERAGAGTIILTGQLSDPRAAYAAADVALGMGGSALRALAFQKPLVVQGERGFWSLLTPESLDTFLWTGWYGVGTAVDTGASTLAGILGGLLADEQRRRELGSFGRRTVEERFSLDRAADIQVDHYLEAIASRPNGFRSLVGDASAFVRYGKYYVAKRVRRALGSERTDDFNATPVRATIRPITARPGVRR
jgi:glycosyltransferase involved in cell wall biosynthesis